MAYIADNGSAGAAAQGVEKWTYNGTSWNQAYDILDPGLGLAASGYYGLAGTFDVAGSNAVLFATTKDGSTLEQITDPLAATGPSVPGNEGYQILATAPANYAFKGVALAAAATPEPGTFALLGVGAMLGLGAFASRRFRRRA